MNTTVSNRSIVLCLAYTRELKQQGRERQRERYKTIDLRGEYNRCTWECHHLATFPPSSLETERENLNSRVLSRTWTLEYESFQYSCSFKNRASNFSYSNTFRQSKKKRMSYVDKKEENGKLRIQQPSSLAFPSQLLKVPTVTTTTNCHTTGPRVGKDANRNMCLLLSTPNTRQIVFF